MRPSNSVRCWRIPLLLALALVVASTVGAQPFDAWAIYGTGSGGYSEIPDAPALNPTGAITLEAWVDFDAGSSGCQSVIGKGFQTSYWLGFCNDRMRSWVGGELVDTMLERPESRWVHLAMTSDGARRRHYFDGALVSDVPEPGSGLIVNANPVQIGRDPDWPIPFTGVIDEVRLWSTARSAEEIRNLMFRAVDVPQPGLVAVWSFGPTETFGNFNGSIVGDVVGLTFPAGACWNTTSQVCLNTRFRVTVEWATAASSGNARTAPAFSADTGVFTFFDPDNWELMIKVLDGCAINNHFWVFMAASTDVEYTVRVVDELTGSEATYFNPLGTASPATTDITALPACSFP